MDRGDEGGTSQVTRGETAEDGTVTVMGPGSC